VKRLSCPSLRGRLPTMSTSCTVPTFAELLSAQVRNEFTASQQYIAIAIWFDAHDLPRLAGHFYRQSVEERNHAMMIVRYTLDRDWPVQIPESTTSATRSRIRWTRSSWLSRRRKPLPRRSRPFSGLPG